MNITVVPLLLTIQNFQLLKLWERRREWPAKPTTINVPARENIAAIIMFNNGDFPASNFSSFILEVAFGNYKGGFLQLLKVGQVP